MNKYVRLSVIAAAAMTLAACGKQEQPAANQAASAPAQTAGDGAVVKIGQVSPMSGPISHLGKDNEYGAKLAIADLNAAGVEIGGKKLKFELVSEDDQGDPKIGTQVAQRLVDAGVAGVVGHLNSGTTIPASKIYSDAGIPQISPSATNPDYTKQGFKTTFRVIANDVQQGRALGEFAATGLKAKKIAIIDDRTAYGQGLADQFEAAVKGKGADVVKREFTTNTATDFNAILTSIKSAKPDLIFYGGMDAQAGPLAKQMQRLGLKAADGRRRLANAGVHQAGRRGFRRSVRVQLRRAARQDAGLCRLQRQVQEAVQHRGVDLRAVRVRRGDGAGGRDEARQVHRPENLSGRSGQDQLHRRDRQDRL